MAIAFLDDSDSSPINLKSIQASIKSRRSWRRQGRKTARLTVITQFFPPDFAATGQLLDDLTTRMAKRGLQVQILTGMPAYAYSTERADHLHFEPNRCIRRSRASRFWPRRIRGRAVNGFLFLLRAGQRLLHSVQRGDLMMYTTEPPYLPFLGYALNALFGTPYIVLLYDLYPDVLVQLKVLPEEHPLIRLWKHLNSLMLRRASEIIVLSQQMADRVLLLTPDVSPRLSIIPSWSDPEAIQPIPRNENWFVQRHGLTESFNVVYSGNQGRCHDLITVIGAALFLKEDPNIRFVFIGQGPQNSVLVKLVRDLNLSNIIFLPYQELEALPYSLAAADVAVVSLSVGTEGLVAPCKVYGHLAAGTPIAAVTPFGSHLQQLVESEGCGQWFANGDSRGLAAWISHLRDNPKEQSAMGRASRRFSLEETHPDKICSDYLEILGKHLPTIYKNPGLTKQPHLSIVQ
ncbi:MAG: glycosyltransferase WbuB [Alphaproteobacteria bacterium]|nr:glycosyltransferase WbuB [Alphaproteobacteria bacterium]